MPQITKSTTLLIVFILVLNGYRSQACAFSREQASAILAQIRMNYPDLIQQQQLNNPLYGQNQGGLNQGYGQGQGYNQGYNQGNLPLNQGNIPNSG